MPSAKSPTQQSFTYVDESGNKLIDFGKDMARFKAVCVPSGRLKLDASQCEPFTAALCERVLTTLDRCAFYMAQSQAGSNALDILSDNKISFVYQKGSARANPGILTPAGYDIQAKKITFDPNYGADLLHLLFIQKAGRVDACKKLEIDDMTSFDLRSGVMAMRSINAYALANVAMHVTQCVAAQAEDPKRFVPPALIETVQELLPTLALASRVPTELTPLFFMQTIFHLYSLDTQDIAIHDKLLLDQYRTHVPRADNVGTPDAEAGFISEYKKFLARDIDHDYLGARLFESDPDLVRENGLDLDGPDYARLVPTPMVERAYALLLQALEEEPSIEIGRVRTGRDLRAALVPQVSPPIGERQFGPN